MLNQPAPFALTSSEAEQIQAVQLARQAGFAGRSKKAALVMAVFSVTAILALFIVDRIAFGGDTPGWFFLSLIAAYLLGMLMHHLVVRMTVTETRSRMLKGTPQVWEERTVDIVDDGLRQLTATASSLFFWSAVQLIERRGEILFVWVTHFNPVVIPDRAFASAADVKDFEAKAKSLAASSRTQAIRQ